MNQLVGNWSLAVGVMIVMMANVFLLVMVRMLINAMMLVSTEELVKNGVFTGDGALQVHHG